jgi:hypothetical protein
MVHFQGDYGLVWMTCAINMPLLAEFRTWVFVDFRQNLSVWSVGFINSAYATGDCESLNEDYICYLSYYSQRE